MRWWRYLSCSRRFFQWANIVEDVLIERCRDCDGLSESRFALSKWTIYSDDIWKIPCLVIFCHENMYSMWRKEKTRNMCGNVHRKDPRWRDVYSEMESKWCVMANYQESLWSVLSKHIIIVSMLLYQVRMITAFYYTTIIKHTNQITRTYSWETMSDNQRCSIRIFCLSLFKS